jgi:hypothetical protein
MKMKKWIHEKGRKIRKGIAFRMGHPWGCPCHPEGNFLSGRMTVAPECTLSCLLIPPWAQAQSLRPLFQDEMKFSF